MMHRLLLRSLVLVSMTATGLGTAQAANFFVNTTDDLVDAVPGDGQCKAPGIGNLCSLRAAIMEANSTPAADFVVLAFGQTYTLTRAGTGEDLAFNGDLDINAPLTITTEVISFSDESRPRVNGGGLDRVFDVRSNNVTLSGFDINGGVALSVGNNRGGGVYVGIGKIGIRFQALRFRENLGQLGGGLYVAPGAEVSVEGSEFIGNRALPGDPQVVPLAAAIRSLGNLVISHSSVHDNVQSPADFAIDALSTGQVQPSSLAILNSTISGNFGGGVRVLGTAGALLLVNSSVVANAGAGVGYAGESGSLALRTSVSAGNLLGDCSLAPAASANVATDQFNADSDNSCGFEGSSTNQFNVDPKLSALAYGQNFTASHRPQPNSPLIDSGHPQVSAQGCLNVDQDGQPRAQDFVPAPGTYCDIGSVEISSDSLFYDDFSRVPMAP